MAALDRFGGPESWDLHCQRQEERYAALISGATCLDCGRCETPDLSEHNGYAGIGWCTEYGEFVFEEDTPETTECGVFTR